jgi:hypothetical protein
VHGRGRRSESKAKPAISQEVSTDLVGNRPLRVRLGGVHRLRAAAARPSPERERLRAVPRAHCGGHESWPQRDGDLAGPRRRSRLSLHDTRVSAGSS